jgi:hypothetical protein
VAETYSPFLLPRRYNAFVPTAHICLVSFTDTNNIRHAVEVAASTLYEAATLAIAEFRRCGFTENAPGPATLKGWQKHDRTQDASVSPVGAMRA